MIATASPVGERHDFMKAAEASRGYDASAVEAVLADSFPGAVLRQADVAEDHRGIDYWVDWKLGTFALDVKFRKRDCHQFGLDDVILERESGGGPGWALDPRKQTDVLAWTWKDTGRVKWVDYRALRDCFIAHAKEWSIRFPVKVMSERAYGKDYETHWMAVPVRVLDDAMAPFLMQRGGILLYEGGFCRAPGCVQTAFYPCDDRAWCGRHFEQLRAWEEPEAMQERRLAMEEANLQAAVERSKAKWS